jgi:hypothetical protein
MVVFPYLSELLVFPEKMIDGIRGFMFQSMEVIDTESQIHPNVAKILYRRVGIAHQI